VTTEVHRPKGDSYGTLGETVVFRHNTPRPLRSLRERQLDLLVLCIATLVIIVDGSVVNVALPTIKTGLGFSQSNLVWVLNAYLIPFGGLLLFAGRLGDLIGTKRVFVSGLSLFTVASVACGLARTQEFLIGARFVQGVGGALASAVVLGMITTMFPKPREQARALGFYAFVAASGAAIGLLAGAALTQAISWHWIFFVNVPICAVDLAFGLRLPGDRRRGEAERGLDVAGAILIIAAMMLSVYTIVQAVNHGWGSERTLILAGVSLLLLIAFAGWQTRARNPLVPLKILRARNVAWANVVMAMMVAGPTGMFFLCALYLQQVLHFSVIKVGFAFLPAAVAIGGMTLKVTPRLMRHFDPRSILAPGLLLIAAGLALFARLPVHGHYAIDILPAVVLIGVGVGLSVPSVLSVALAEATTSDSGVRSGLINTTQQIGGALGLAVLGTVSTSRTIHALAQGHSAASALTSGYRMAFLVGAAIVAGAFVLARLALKPAIPDTAPTHLDPTRRGATEHTEDLTGAVDPEFLALGLSGTNMMAMLWSVAMGRRSVGIELRGDPFAAQMHLNIREDLYHHLEVIDRLMIERYGEDRLPRLGDGSLFQLHEVFFSTNPDSSGDSRADEVLSGFIPDSHIAGLVQDLIFVDDRWVDGKPTRTVDSLGPAPRPAGPDSGRVGRPMADVLAERSAFQVGSQELLLVLRRYLRAMERMDLAAGVPPRCRLFPYHRVVVPRRRRPGRFSWLPVRAKAEPGGFAEEPDGRQRIRVEAITELYGKRRYRRVRRPGTQVIDMGVPELFVIAEGLDSDDAARLGFRPQQVTTDHHDGRGQVATQADYLIGLMTIFVDSRHIRRISSEFDSAGNEYWIRQVAIGHEDDAENAWVAVEIPDFRAFDPIAAGLTPRGTDPASREYFGGNELLVREYFLDQVAVLTGIPRAEVARTSIAATPTLLTVQAKIGADAQVAANGVVAGDSFGNGDFLTSGGINTGMIGHAHRVWRYWQDRAAGTEPAAAIATLSAGIKADTAAWVAASETEFRQPPAADPARRSATADPGREAVLEATRRRRRAVNPGNSHDTWSLITLFVGRLHSYPLPALPTTHPLADQARETAEARQTDESEREMADHLA
jgi:EmrB/QacA subfamily drug resistance transporter